MKRLLQTSIIGLLAVGLAACNQDGAPAPEPAATPTSPKLSVSINAAMVAMVDHSADYIFAVGNGDLPKNDGDWQQVRNSAYEMMLAGAVIRIPGTGQFDQQWVDTPEWQAFAKQLTADGEKGLALADAKSTDVEAWRAIGDDLIQTCLQCHEKFKPEIPSEGILRGSTERQSRGESIFN